MANVDLQHQRVDTLSVRVQDMHGRQIKNLGVATDSGDAVVLSQLQDQVKQLQAQIDKLNKAVGI